MNLESSVRIRAEAHFAEGTATIIRCMLALKRIQMKRVKDGYEDNKYLRLLHVEGQSSR